MPRSLIVPDLKIRVSSTLDKSVSKKFLTDGNLETCWSSSQGTPQFVQLMFPKPVVLETISLTFQGGFVGTQCAVYTLVPSNDWKLLTRIFPENVNRRQVFDLSKQCVGVEQSEQMKIVFEESSDFFGRITIYDLDIEGSVIVGDNNNDTID